MDLIARLSLGLDISKKMPSLIPLVTAGRMQPSFFIIGFQKCGTTALYDALTQHPDVRAGWVKENNILSQIQENIGTFRLMFPYGGKSKITGDASHLYTWAPFGLERVKRNYPKAKLILVMRDPIARAYSHFKMDQRIGYIPSEVTFEQFIDVELSIRRSLSLGASAEEQYHGMNWYGNKYGWPLSRGLYHLYIDKLDRLGMDFHAFFLEELVSDFNHEWQRLQSILKLKDHPVIFSQSNKGGYQVNMTDSSYSLLMNFYREPNAQLAKRLNRPLPWA